MNKQNSHLKGKYFFIHSGDHRKFTPGLQTPAAYITAVLRYTLEWMKAEAVRQSRPLLCPQVSKSEAAEIIFLAVTEQPPQQATQYVYDKCKLLLMNQ